MNEAPPRASVTTDKASTLRMLEGLDSAGRPSFEPFDESPAGRWKVPATLAVLAIIAVAMWWWTQQAAPEPNVAPEVAAQKPLPSAVTTAVAGPAAFVAAVAASASVAAEPRTSLAPNESLPEQIAAPRPSSSTEDESPASKRAPVPAPTELSPPRRIADAGHPPLPSRPVAAKAKSAKPVAKSAPSNQSVKTPEATVATLAGDADIALLGAMLRHIERDGTNDLAATQTPLTIAQLVHRCDASTPQNEDENYECKRRICDGYWGKADACPKSMAQRKTRVLKALLQE